MTAGQPRLKWHMLRRRRGDPPHLRANLAAGLAAGAALEVDLVPTADGHFVCLHDLTLDAETTGAGPVADATRADLMRLRQRGPGGVALDSPPLFLDEVVSAARAGWRRGGGLVQLDVKAPERMDAAIFARLRSVIGDQAPRFIASSYDPGFVATLQEALPGVARGFDPLALYARGMPHDAVGFEALAEDTHRLAPDVGIYYLEADLIVAGLDAGVNMVAAVAGGGAEVDAWTVDADRPGLLEKLRRLIAAGVDQITTNDPDVLTAILEEIA